MHQVIARTWRPQRFSEVIGQRHVTQTLQNALRRNRIGHGYIFSGQRGVGKTTVARLLAKALNCHQGPQPEPCGECDSCKEIAAGRAVDVIEIDAASNRGIDAVRELRENVRYAPARDRYKVFIIDEAHQITPEGFNALLKTLEEPPPHVIFVLATTEIHELPETILSRCQHFAFRAVSFTEVLSQLEKVCAAEGVQADKEALAALAAAAEGSLRDALSRLEQAITAFGTPLEGAAVLRLLGAVPSQLVEEVFLAVRERNRERVLQVVARLVEEGYQLPHFCSQIIRAVRNMLVIQVAGPQPHLLECSPEESDRLAALAANFSEEDLTRFLEILLHLHQQLRYTMDPRFYLELGLLKLVEAERLVAIEELLAQSNAGARPRAAPESSASVSAKNSTVASSSPLSEDTVRGKTVSPFEQDRLRKRQNPGPSALADAPLGTAPASTSAPSFPAEQRATATAVVSEPPASPHATDLPSRENAWAHEVLRRLEESSKHGLLSLISTARWEFGEEEARLQPASAGIAKILTQADLQTLERVVGDVVGRKVRVSVVEESAERAAPNRGRGPSTSLGTGESQTSGTNFPEKIGAVESRVREDPEIREFERLFGKPVTGIRKWKE